MAYLFRCVSGSYRLVSLVLAMALSAASISAQPIVFPHENVSDARGLLNIFHVFRKACLDQPTDPELPGKVSPEGYQIVTFQAHMGFEDTGDLTRSATLSKTGLEQGDWDGGHPIVVFTMPTGDDPDGRCTVSWRRAWDYEEGKARIALGMFGALDAQVSYHLQAFLNTPPPDSFLWKQPVYSGVNEWVTWCWQDRLCKFDLRYSFDPDFGVDISITRQSVQGY